MVNFVPLFTPKLVRWSHNVDIILPKKKTFVGRFAAEVKPIPPIALGGNTHASNPNPETPPVTHAPSTPLHHQVFLGQMFRCGEPPGWTIR